MPQFLKLMMTLLVAGLALTACGPSSGDDGAGGDAPTEEAAPSDDTTAQ